MDIDPNDPPVLADFGSSFRLASPVIVLGSVTPGRRAGPLPPPVAHQRDSVFGTPFGFDEFAICVNGYAVGLVFFEEGTGSEERAVERWNNWGGGVVFDNE